MTLTSMSEAQWMVVIADHTKKLRDELHNISTGLLPVACEGSFMGLTAFMPLPIISIRFWPQSRIPSNLKVDQPNHASYSGLNWWRLPMCCRLGSACWMSTFRTLLWLINRRTS
jgi:hypothetical protein